MLVDRRDARAYGEGSQEEFRRRLFVDEEWKYFIAQFHTLY